MSIRLPVLLALALSLLAACDQWPGGASTSTLNMTGTWSYHDGPITTRYDLRADGTCTESVSLPSFAPPQPDKQGKWRLDRGDTVLRIDLSNGSPDPVQKIFPITVNGSSISFTGDNPNSVFTR